jgi:hypothetical protein
MTLTAPVISSTLSPHAQRHKEPAHLRRRRFAGHHLLEGRGGFLARERSAGCHFGDERPELDRHGAPLN